VANGIPSVRRWLVNYWLNGRVVWSCKVSAPTRQFALWAAADKRRMPTSFANAKLATGADKITATVLRSSH
jgi:hypothetical protein